jgi:uncharacterized metal-binding protein YceD (DUF177 family)
MTGYAEFPRSVGVGEVFRKGGLSLTLEANPDEREAIARRLGLVELSALRADLSVVPWQDEGLMVRGTLTADLSQSCVVTLEPVPAHLSDTVEARYLPGAEPAILERDEMLSDPDAPDPPEPLPAGGILDLGELLIQHLAVALDPYPRKPGVAFTPPEEDLQALGPFAKLSALKRPKP